MKEVGKEEFLEEFLKLLPITSAFGVEWVVTSNAEGCPDGYTKVYLRRKRVPKPWQSLKVRHLITECLSNEEAEELKKQIRKWLE